MELAALQYPTLRVTPQIIETTEAQTVEFDHQYCSRPHLKSISSDSGISNDTSSNGPISPPTSDNFSDSPTSGMSPRSSHDDLPHMSPLNEETADSPLGGGYEDLQLGDFNFESLDTSALLTDDDFLNSIVEDPSTSNITLDLRKCKITFSKKV